jgi:putative acetyltransferase
MTKLIRTNSDNADFRELVALLDADLAIRHVVVAYEGETAVGCGAFKEYERGAAEIKRMFVRENVRGRGIAKLILGELEAWAKESGYTECVLETGLKQPEAIALYRKGGYEIIPNYGQYAGVENSVCMKKLI